MLRWFSNLPLFSGQSGNVFRGMVTLTGGLVAGRVIGLFAIPILTRIYDPADFGALSVYTALVSLISPFAALRYPVAIPLPRRDRLAVSVVALCFLLIGTFGTAIALMLWLAAPDLLPLLSMEALIPFWWIIAVGVVASATYETLSGWAARRKNYKLIAKTAVMQSFSGSAVKLGFGFLVAGPIGLLLGQVMSQGGGGGAFLRHYAGEFRAQAGKLRIRQAARLFSSFALYRLPAQALLAAAIQAPILFVAARYDAAQVGQYGLALTVVAVPSTLLVQGLSKAFYSEVAALGIRQLPAIRAITLATMKRLSIAGFPLALLLVLFGQELSIILFGERWSQAGLFSELLAIYLFSSLVAAPVMRLLDLLREQRLLLLINGLRLLLVVVVFMGLPEIGFTLVQVVLAYSVSMLLLHAFSGWLVLHRLKKRANL